MFCKNCGIQISDNSKFCPSCGTPTDGTPAATPAAQAAPAATTAAPANNTADSLQPILKAVLSTKGLYVISVVLLLLAFIFFFTDTLHATVKYGGEKMSSTFTLTDYMQDQNDLEGWGVFTILINIIAVIVAALSFVPQLKFSSGKLWVARIASLWMTAWMIVGMIAVGIDVGDYSGFGVDVSAGATFTGWMVLLLSIASIAVSVKVALDMRKANKSSAKPKFSFLNSILPKS